MNKALIHYDTFADLASTESLISQTYDRTIDTFEAVDLLEEIRRVGDRVLALARRGRLPPAQAAVLLQELMACFAEPLHHTRQLEQAKRTLRRYDE